VLLAGLSCLVAVACVVASARRLAQAVALTALHPEPVLEALRGDLPVDVRGRLCAVLGGDDRFAWEQGLLEAFAPSDARLRDALVNEQLTELDGRAQRWARIPRVCASVATSAGFLLASVVLVQGLAVSPGDADPTGNRAVVEGALDAVAIGIAGASFCFAVHVRARRIVRDRLAAVGRLVVRLESVASETGGGSAGALTRLGE
jgi:hypothetical protein